MQKEKIFILSFGGAKDVLVGKSSYFRFWRPRDRSLLLLIFKDRSLILWGSILVAWCAKITQRAAFTRRRRFQNTNFDLEQASFAPEKLPSTPPTSSNQFLLRKHFKTLDFNSQRKLSHSYFFFTSFSLKKLSFFLFKFFSFPSLLPSDFFLSKFISKIIKNSKIRENVQISQKSYYL